MSPPQYPEETAAMPPPTAALSRRDNNGGQAESEDDDDAESTPRHVQQQQQQQQQPKPQYLLIIRHGDRWDYSNPDWKLEAGKRTGDSPLSTLGHTQARETGIWLSRFFTDHNLSPNNLVWLSSPFLRCLQTSDDALNAATTINPDFDSTKINVEYSIFEWDGHDGSWHADLPSLVDERQHYFPRIDLSYESVFIPPLPEPRSKFFERCEKSVRLLTKSRFPYKPGQVLVCVSHAAGCLALAHKLSGRPLNEITPAGPCSVYAFTRTSSSSSSDWNDDGDSNSIDGGWKLDDHDQPGSMNGYTSHLSDLGTSTKPWHNFGDGVTKFYTGPPTSRFAPPSKPQQPHDNNR